MRTAEFLRAVLPSQGNYFLAVPHKNGGYIHKAYQDVDKLAEAALHVSERGLNAFFALASYEHPEYIGDDGKKHWRTGENARMARAQWMDMDGDKKQNLRDLWAFCASTGVPRPNILVDSGNGVHVYWIFDRDVPRDMWLKSAGVFKALLAHHNVAQQDTKRTADISSVLRPVGCTNDKTHKGLGIKPVKILGSPNLEPVSFTGWVRTLVDAKAKFGVSLPKSVTPTENINSDLGGGMEYPASSAHIVAEHCAQIRVFRDFKGAGQSEPVWRNCLGVVKHCVEGEELCHEWSTGHDGYDAGETAAKIDGWKTGPATCASFKADNAAGCDGCPHTVKSPIQLGKLAPEQATEVTQVDEATQEVITEELPEMPADIAWRFRFTGTYLEARVEDKEGVVSWEAFCNTYVRPVGYFMDRNDKNSWKMRIDCRMRPGKWQLFEVTSRAVGQGGAVLMGELSAKAFVVPAFGRSKHLEDYMRTWAEHLKHSVEETTMHTHMGWQPDNSFVVGDRKYMPDGTVKRVVLDEALRNQIDDYEPRGDISRWSQRINELYNRDGHQMYQFNLMSGFASPLINLITQDPIGLINVALGEGGRGKTTVSKITAGIWHRTSKTITDATEHGLYLSAGQRRNIPLVLDETSMWEPKQVASFAYRYSTGTARIQGAASGGLRDNSHLNWNNIAILTTNKSVYEAIQTHQADCIPQLMRVFEYSFDLPHDQNAAVDEGLAAITELLSMNGIAGEIFAKHMVMNRDEIRDKVLDAYVKIMKAAGLNKEARFWCQDAAAVWVAFQESKKLGLHDFNGKDFLTWLINQLKASMLKVHQATKDMGLVLGDLMADLHSGFIVTVNEGHNNGTAAAFAPGAFPPRGDITGRVILSQNTVYLKYTSVRDWCTKYGFSVSELKKALDYKGWTKPANKYSLGRGTSFSIPQTRVWKLDWAAVSGQLQVVNQSQVQQEEVAA